MIIAFIGDIGSGKSTCGKIIEELVNSADSGGFEHYSFAGPLKQIAEIFGFEKSEIYGTQEQKIQVNEFWGVSGRIFLEKLGTDIFREQLSRVLPTMTADYSIWIKLFQKHIKTRKSSHFVVDDCRFVEEAAFIKENGGYIIRVVNNNNTKPQSSHVSAVEHKKIRPDFVIDNSRQDDNFESLRRQLSDVLTTILMGLGDIGAITYVR